MPYSVYYLTMIFTANNEDCHISLEFADKDLATVREIADTISKIADNYSGKADVFYNPECKPILYGWYIFEAKHYKKESAYHFFGVDVEEYAGARDYYFKKQYRVECEEYLSKQGAY